MFWKVVIAWIFTSVLSYALSGRPQGPNRTTPPPAGIDEFKVPTAQAGRDIPVLFGARWIKGSNVVWYGDLRTEPITETIDGSKK